MEGTVLVPTLGRLAEVRKARFLTQAELAERAKISRPTIARLERGDTEARLKTVRQLAEALGVEPSAIVSAGRES